MFLTCLSGNSICIWYINKIPILRMGKQIFCYESHIYKFITIIFSLLLTEVSKQIDEIENQPIE